MKTIILNQHNAVPVIHNIVFLGPLKLFSRILTLSGLDTKRLLLLQIQHNLAWISVPIPTNVLGYPILLMSHGTQQTSRISSFL